MAKAVLTPPRLVSVAVIAQITGLSVHTLKSKRLTGELQQGVHWHRRGPRNVWFDEEMMRHWAEWRHSPGVHALRVEQRLAENVELEKAIARGLR